MKTLERENESLSTSLKEVHSSLNDVTHSYSFDEPHYDYSSYYDGSAPYGSVSHDSTATSTSTPSASAPQGAESTAVTAEEGATHSATQTTPPAGSVNGEAAAEHQPLKS